MIEERRANLVFSAGFVHIFMSFSYAPGHGFLSGYSTFLPSALLLLSCFHWKSSLLVAGLKNNSVLIPQFFFLCFFVTLLLTLSSLLLQPLDCIRTSCTRRIWSWKAGVGWVGKLKIAWTLWAPLQHLWLFPSAKSLHGHHWDVSVAALSQSTLLFRGRGMYL